MKNFAFAFIVLTALLSFPAIAKSSTGEADLAIAADRSPRASSEKLINLVYYPHAKHFLLSGYLQSSATSNSTISDDTGTLSESVLTFTRLGIDGTMGLTDRLRFSVALNQLIEQDNVSVSDTDGTANDHVSRGLSDPQITFAYRILENFDRAFFSDIVVTTQTSFGPSVTATGGQSGNNKTGSWASQVALPVYWLVARHEFELAPSINRNFGGRETGTNIKTDRSDENYWSTSVTLRDRFHLTEVFFLEPTAVLHMEHAYNSFDHSVPAVSRNVRVPLYVSAQLAAGYVITPWCLLDLLLTYDGYESRSSSGAVTRSNDISNANFTLKTSFTF